MLPTLTPLFDGWARVFWGFVFASSLIGCSGERLGSSADERALDKYLCENLSDPDYKVMRFWPARELASAVEAHCEWRRAELATARDGLKKQQDKLDAVRTENRRRDDVERKRNADFGDKVQREKDEADRSKEVDRLQAMVEIQAERLKRLEASPPKRICRLRFRAKNNMGGLQIYDRLYEIDRGTASQCDGIVTKACEKEFPE